MTKKKVNDKILALNILHAAKFHKEHCNKPVCGVSLYLLGVVYKKLIGRQLTDEEGQKFL